MCEALKEAVESANRNTQIMAETIDALSIPCDYKGVFLHMADERGFRFDKETLRQMEEIGKTKSKICLMILNGNHKHAGLISAYRLATELDNDKDRAEVVQIIQDSKSKTINEKKVLLEILTVKGKKGVQL